MEGGGAVTRHDFMKAIVLAGGAGTRLRPISANCPKPMVRLFDRPVLEYGFELLKKHGFTDITATLQTMPAQITDYFGDGSDFGVKLSYSVETSPMGTAGGVRAALGVDTNGGCLVFSGDAVTDFDLADALRFHNNKRADVTILLSHQKKLLEYGLVMTDGDGRITRFIEKPSWNQVFSDLVNTGIYILSSSALQMIPENTVYDFSQDLFPLMLGKGMALYGYAANGYWCDIGDAEAFVNCCHDILDGHIKLSIPPQAVIAQGVQVTPPYYAAQGAIIEDGAKIGPYAIIGSQSKIGAGAVCEASVIDGGELEPYARVEGAYLGHGAVVKSGAVVREGSVVGAEAVIGEGAELLEGARVWPRKEIPAGVKVSGSVSHGSTKRGTLFDGNGIIRGRTHIDLTPEVCFRLGAAASEFSGGETALGWYGGEAARLCAAALEVGASSSGGCAVIMETQSVLSAAFGGSAYKIPVSIFVLQTGTTLELHFFDKLGLPLDRAAERKIETVALRGDTVLAAENSLRSPKRLLKLDDLYSAAASGQPEWFDGHPAPARAEGTGRETQLLRKALALSGAEPSGAGFAINSGELSVTLETGEIISHERLLCLIAVMEAGFGTRVLALPDSAPSLCEDLCRKHGMTSLRPSRDGQTARELLSAQRFMRDPVFMALRLCYGLGKQNMTLKQLSRKVPGLFITSSVVQVESDRGAVMRALAQSDAEAELRDGYRARVGSGWVHISPLPNRSALRVTAEGGSEELAGEICVEFSKRARKLDGDLSNNMN